MTEQPLELLTRALDQMSSVIGDARYDDAGHDRAGAPTPCPDWDVQALTEHVIMDVDRFTLAAAGGRPDWSALVPGVDGDWREAFDAKTPALIREWSKINDFETPVRMPIGEVPQSFVVKQQLAEFAVHAWDLAQATGQHREWDEEIARTALDWSRMSLKPDFRGTGKAFGPAAIEPVDATPTEALVAWFGRDPSWSAPR
jgi:uncharacterized protein (TIGR03086 family)